MEGIIHWFSRNHVAANFLMAAVVVMGITTWGTLKKEIFPETSIDAINIAVPFPTATPEEVEKGVCVPIEEAIQDVDGIKRITSSASQGAGSVTVEVQTGFKVRDVMDDLKTRIDAIRNLAEQAEEPILEEIKIKNQVLSIAVSADTDEKTLRSITEKVREDLLAYRDGSNRVTQAIVVGARDYEISIEVSEETLRSHGLTFDQVAAAVRQSSLDLPGGSLRTGAGEILIRTERRRYTADEFGEVTVVTRPDGSVLKLREIARIIDGFEEDEVSTRYNGRNAMLINVYRVGNEDTLRVAKAAKDFVGQVAPRVLPQGVELEIWQDDSKYLSGRMNLLARNGMFGLLLVFIVLALFLRPSLAFLVALGIPVAFAGAVALMPHTGISVNLISLFAFILVLGIVVDDAIVVGENVYRRIRLGEHPRDAAPNGTHEVGVVVTFGVLTTIVAFTPMLGLSGVSGKIWPNIPLIVIPTLLVSLVQSKLVLPAHLSLLRPYDPDHQPGPVMRFQRIFSRGLERFIEVVYRPFLRRSLRHRYIVLSAFIALFLVTLSLITTGWIKFIFFPVVEGDVLSAKIELASGVPFEVTERAVARLESAAESIRTTYQDREGEPIIRRILTSVGTQPFIAGNSVGLDGAPRASHLGEVTVELQPAASRDLTATELVSLWRKEAGSIPGAVSLTFIAETAGGGNAIDLQLVGDDLVALEEAAAAVKEALGTYSGVIDIASSDRRGNKELKLDILPEGEALGLRLEDVARQVRQGFYGEEVQRLQRGRDEVEVFVRYPADERQAFSDLSNTKIRTREGAEVPFGTVAVVRPGRAYESIQRIDRRRSVKVTADIDETSGANANEIVAALTHDRTQTRPRPGAPEMPDGILTIIRRDYPGVDYTFEGEQKDQADSVREIGQKALLALLGMYVLLAIPLRSYFQPLIVMSVIPFGLVGAVWGHIFMGLDLSIMSMCGIVALAGVVVNDSLVLVDFVNRERASGHDIAKAAWEAGASRFRPILLTSLTTFAGLTPMLLETDLQARFLIPMAVALAFGILFATAITLILIPSVYLILHDVQDLIQGKARKPVEGSLPSTEATATL